MPGAGVLQGSPTATELDQLDVAARVAVEGHVDLHQLRAVGDRAVELDPTVVQHSELSGDDLARLAVLERDRRRVPEAGPVDLGEVLDSHLNRRPRLDHVLVPRLEQRAHDLDGLRGGGGGSGHDASSSLQADCSAQRSRTPRNNTRSYKIIYFFIIFVNTFLPLAICLTYYVLLKLFHQYRS